MPLNPLRPLGIWLSVWAAMLFLLIAIGGATRLTESGLSITEWKPVAGVLPPLDDAAWDREFERYQQIPQYRDVNRGMSLDAFKRIYFWEYTHRLWARLVGVAFLVPYLIFSLRGMVPRAMRGKLLVLLALLGFQGALGWFMVTSGLSERTSVSQYRLAAHLAAALLIFGATVWTAAGMFAPVRRATSLVSERVRRSLVGLIGMIALTAVAGAFVAGLRAGRAYNTFPLMGGKLIPDGYGRLSPWLRNLFENIPAVQFNHRVLATMTATAIVIVWMWSRRLELPARARRCLSLMAMLAIMQFMLGVLTLLKAVPVTLGVAHQGGAVLLLTVALLALHAVTRERSAHG